MPATCEVEFDERSKVKRLIIALPTAQARQKRNARNQQFPYDGWFEIGRNRKKLAWRSSMFGVKSNKA
jgi:hypothetical protein